MMASIASQKDDEEALRQAVSEEDLEAVKRLIKKGADVNAKNENGKTPLNIAVVLGYVEIAQLLIKKGADVNAKDIYGRTPLHNAVMDKRIDLMKLLLDSGADINAKDNDLEFTPLHRAVIYGPLEIAQLLIEEGADVNAKDIYGRTPLNRAAEKDDLEAARLLIAEGAEIDAKDDGDRTPLHYAVAFENLAIVNLLIEKDANVDAMDTKIRTPLHAAVMEGNLEITRLLIEKGANVDAQDTYIKTPLHYAAKYGKLEIARLLIEKGANVDEDGDRDSMTPLEYAAKYGKLEIARLLIEKGANIDALNTFGKNALHYAAEYGKLEIAWLLIEKGADVTIKDEDGKLFWEYVKEEDFRKEMKALYELRRLGGGAKDSLGRTPLHKAAENDYLKTARLLIAAGAEIDAKDNKGWTPLLTAAFFEKSKVAKLLIEKGADVNAKNRNGMTVLHLAAHFENFLEVAIMLIEKGANVNAKNILGWTPLVFAVRFNISKVAKLLIEKGAKVDAKDNNGKTSLHFVGERGDNVEIAQLLIAAVANLEARDNDGETPLFSATFFGKSKLAKLLIEKGAKVDAVDKNGRTSLYLAVQRGSLESAKVLIDAGADVNSGQPLLEAATLGNVAIARLLVRKGADMNARQSSTGKTALHYAAEYGQPEIAQLLAKSGADVNIKDNDGKLFWKYAEDEDFREKMEALYERYRFSDRAKKLSELRRQGGGAKEIEELSKMSDKEFEDLVGGRAMDECTNKMDVVEGSAWLASDFRNTVFLRVTDKFGKQRTFCMVEKFYDASDSRKVEAEVKESPIVKVLRARLEQAKQVLQDGFYYVEKEDGEKEKVTLSAQDRVAREQRRVALESQITTLTKNMDPNQEHKGKKKGKDRERTISDSFKGMFFSDWVYRFDAGSEAERAWMRRTIEEEEEAEREKEKILKKKLFSLMDEKMKLEKEVVANYSPSNNSTKFLELVEETKKKREEFEKAKDEHFESSIQLMDRESLQRLQNKANRTAEEDAKLLQLGKRFNGLLDKDHKAGDAYSSADAYGRSGKGGRPGQKRYVKLEFANGANFYVEWDDLLKKVVKRERAYVDDENYRGGRREAYVPSFKLPDKWSLPIAIYVKQEEEPVAIGNEKGSSGSSRTHGNRTVSVYKVRRIVNFETYDSIDRQRECLGEDCSLLHKVIGSREPEEDLYYTVKALIEKGEDVNQEYDYEYPLHVAVKKQLISVTRLLLEKGANVNALAYAGNTALHVASEKENIFIVKLLIEFGADVNIKDDEGWTALHFAGMQVNYEIVELLLKKGAVPNIKNEHGETFLDLMRMRPMYSRVPKEVRERLEKLFPEVRGTKRTRKRSANSLADGVDKLKF